MWHFGVIDLCANIYPHEKEKKSIEAIVACVEDTELTSNRLRLQYNHN